MDGRAERFDADGWLDTGDLGRLDADGYLFLAGRTDDVINRGGELVYPREIEEVLLADDAVLDAVVVGRPDDILGAVPVAYVIATRSADASTRRAGRRTRAAMSRAAEPLQAPGGRRTRRRPAPGRDRQDPPHEVRRAAMSPVDEPRDDASTVATRGHVYEADVVRVLTFACVIAVHTVSHTEPTDSVTANGVRDAAALHPRGVLRPDRLRAAAPEPRPAAAAAGPHVLAPPARRGRRALRRLVGHLHRHPEHEPASARGRYELAPPGRNLAYGTAWYHLYFLLVSMQIYLLFPLIERLVRAHRRATTLLLLAVSAVVQLAIADRADVLPAAHGWLGSGRHATRTR